MLERFSAVTNMQECRLVLLAVFNIIFGSLDGGDRDNGLVGTQVLEDGVTVREVAHVLLVVFVGVGRPEPSMDYFLHFSD